MRGHACLLFVFSDDVVLHAIGLRVDVVLGADLDVRELARAQQAALVEGPCEQFAREGLVAALLRRRLTGGNERTTHEVVAQQVD